MVEESLRAEASDETALRRRSHGGAPGIAGDHVRAIVNARALVRSSLDKGASFEEVISELVSSAVTQILSY